MFGTAGIVIIINISGYVTVYNILSLSPCTSHIVRRLILVLCALCVLCHLMLTTLGPHPLLAQVPLTVSPFISLPTAVTLPYTYKSVSSTLPPSVTVDPANSDAKARYVVSSSGSHAAHPEEILASCESLEEHLKKTQADAETLVKEWEESVKQRELAEKRRVAPGWLDREEKLLQPTQASPTPASKPPQQSQPTAQDAQETPAIVRDEGEELDRAFGGLDVK